MCFPMFLKTGSGGIDIFLKKVVLTFEMLTYAGNSIHFRPTNGSSCESVKVFETENVSTWGGLEPPTFGFMANTLTIIWVIRARRVLSHVFEYWLWWYRYFWSKVNIWQGSTLTVVRLGIPSSFCCRTTWIYVYGCPLVKLRKLSN